MKWNDLDEAVQQFWIIVGIIVVVGLIVAASRWRRSNARSVLRSRRHG